MQGNEMTYKDILLVLTSYPEPSAVAVVDRAIDFASSIGATLSAISCEVKHDAIDTLLDRTLVDAGDVVATEGRKSRSNAEQLLTAFEEKARQKRVFGERIFDQCDLSRLPDLLAGYAHFRDLAIVGAPEHSPSGNGYLESVIFASGRPTLVLPELFSAACPFTLDRVVIAWDFSRSAARAVADALPLLTKSTQVRILVVVDEKPLDEHHSVAELGKHLATHGIIATLDEVECDGRSIGEVIGDCVTTWPADLLVMGAFAHSRMRDLVLGGATKSVLAKPMVPVLLSH